jgi:hypothetical protein
MPEHAKLEEPPITDAEQRDLEQAAWHLERTAQDLRSGRFSRNLLKLGFRGDIERATAIIDKL